MSRTRTVLLGLVLANLWVFRVDAHTRSQSFSTWTITESGVRVTYSVEAREVTRLPPVEGPIPDLGTLLAAHLRSRLTVLADGRPCAIQAGPHALSAQPGYVVVEVEFARPPGSILQIVNNAFFVVAPSHVHYARIQSEQRPPVEHVFSDAARRLILGPDADSALPASGASVFRFLSLGVSHIFAGIDHIAFLLTLLLLCSRASEVLLMVTGFTLGHSVTLGLAVMGLVQPDVPVIEALIAFTIAIVAVENIAIHAGLGKMLGLGSGLFLLLVTVVGFHVPARLPSVTLFGLAVFSVCYLRLNDTRERAVRFRPLLTVVFGLIHGFGFASVLTTLQLPRERILSCLFGFNLGVELGQVLIVAALWVVGSQIYKWLTPRGRLLGMELASAALCAFGVFWFVSRSFP